MAHSFMTVQFLYQSRMVTAKNAPLLFQWLPYGLYPAATFGFFYFIYSKNSTMLAKLDAKYTSIWLKIS